MKIKNLMFVKSIFLKMEKYAYKLFINLKGKDSISVFNFLSSKRFPYSSSFQKNKSFLKLPQKISSKVIKILLKFILKMEKYSEIFV